jgi:hypothetical protein
MTERPILFSAEMVRAILAGRKTQTRRVIKPVPTFNGGGTCHDADALQQDYVEPHWVFPKICKYGAPGDTLWVRETWAHYQTVNHVWRSEGRAFDEVSDGLAGYRADGHDSIEDFRAHVRLMSGCDLEHVIINGDRWRPSIHMPRWASRITLRITDVRVERLQDISEGDARAEGCPYPPEWAGRFMDRDETAKTWFKSLWNHIHGPDAWQENPWVWVISFERVKP